MAPTGQRDARAGQPEPLADHHLPDVVGLGAGHSHAELLRALRDAERQDAVDADHPASTSARAPKQPVTSRMNRSNCQACAGSLPRAAANRVAHRPGLAHEWRERGGLPDGAHDQRWSPIRYGERARRDLAVGHFDHHVGDDAVNHSSSGSSTDGNVGRSGRAGHARAPASRTSSAGVCRREVTDDLRAIVTLTAATRERVWPSSSVAADVRHLERPASAGSAM